MKIEHYFDIQQDTLVKPQQHQIQSFPNITVRKSQIDLERTEELIKQIEQREQQEEDINDLQPLTTRPKPETIRKPSIEVDPLLAKYRHIGCSPRESFPDTFSLTILERYYQPMHISALLTDATGDAALTPLKIDRLQTITVADTSSVKPGNANKPKPSGYPSSITFFLICGLVLLAFIKYNFGKNLSEAFRSFFSYNKSQRLFEEHRESDRQASFFSNVLFTLTAGIFLSVALPFFGVSSLWENYTLSILFFSLATSLLYFLKSVIWKILGIIFMSQSFTKIYIYNMYLYNRNIGLIIFPLVTLIPYVNEVITPVIVYSILVILVLSYILKIWRIFQIIHAQNVSVFYLILYLCTLEILPLLLFIKGCKTLSEFNLFS